MAGKSWLVNISVVDGEPPIWEAWASAGHLSPAMPTPGDIKYYVGTEEGLYDLLEELGTVLLIAAKDAQFRGRRPGPHAV